MSLTIPSGQYDLASFGIMIFTCLIMLCMIIYRCVYVTHSGPFGFFEIMNESSWAHTILYIGLFFLILVSIILMCIN
jgi:hypothetical protein